jgi:hypothetical protein
MLSKYRERLESAPMDKIQYTDDVDLIYEDSDQPE